MCRGRYLHVEQKKTKYFFSFVFTGGVARKGIVILRPAACTLGRTKKTHSASASHNALPSVRLWSCMAAPVKAPWCPRWNVLAGVHSTTNLFTSTAESQLQIFSASPTSPFADPDTDGRLLTAHSSGKNSPITSKQTLYMSLTESTSSIYSV